MPTTAHDSRSVLGGTPFRMTRRVAVGGFSLVEVVIAIGVIAFAFIPMMGMLPTGLNLSRQAIDATVEAQIAQQLTAEVQQTDFSRLEDLASSSVVNPYYFDDQGSKVADPANAIYQAIFAISTSTTLPDAVATQKLATVTLCVLNTKSNRTSQEQDLTKNPDSKKITLLVPDNGR
ncbi:MAG: Verru_Chthon cassette protein B [Chthoniobacter sp.]